MVAFALRTLVICSTAFKDHKYKQILINYDNVIRRFI